MQTDLLSVLSYVTISTALPTRLDLNIGSFSRRVLHFRARVSIFSMAALPTVAVTFLISSNHCFMDAVTAFCTWSLSEGKEDNICWYNGVCDSDVNGMV